MTETLEKIRKSQSKVVLFGAGDLGRLAFYALKKNNIKVDFFCDSNEKKQNKEYLGVKIISPKILASLEKDASIFMCNSQYIEVVSNLLKKLNFTKIYDLVNLLKNTDFSDCSLDQDLFSPPSIERQISLHEQNCLKANRNIHKKLYVSNIDIVITERCSLKCKDCANLMQYYHRPQNAEHEILFEATDTLMKCIDNLYEFRILGGDPFMNKKMYEVVNKVQDYKNVEQIVVYTNATILPKDENFKCLTNKKVRLHITNYGLMSRKHDELVDLCKKNKIKFVSERVKKWQDVGTINYEEKSEKQLETLFKNCCANNLLTLFDGKLYRCPTAAHGVKLKAIPEDPKDIVELGKNKLDLKLLKDQIKEFYYNKKYISACSYCKGRDFGFGEIDAAIQTKKPLTLPSITEKKLN
jgi:organic radical activating enzyme|tara:strand:- start:1949 stop:3181 length:1233 start_codon:yes stop_codon:yes gene_type:complete